MSKKVISVNDTKAVTSTSAVRMMLAHNNLIHPNAIKALNNRGIATPKDILRRASQSLC